MKTPTSCVRLRALELCDAPLLGRLENNPEVWWLGESRVPLSQFYLEAYLESTLKEDFYSSRQIRFVVEIDDGQACRGVGLVDLFDFDPRHRRAGIGILIDPQERRKGYGRQALIALCAYAQQTLLLHQVWAYVPVPHTESRQLFESVGFLEQARLSDWLLEVQGPVDVAVYQRIFTLIHTQTKTFIHETKS